MIMLEVEACSIRLIQSKFSVLFFMVIFTFCSISYGDTLREEHHALPAPEELGKIIDDAEKVIRVYEPHLTKDNQLIPVEYVGYEANPIFSEILGQNWHNQKADIEFRALDGYIARIEVSKFLTYSAYLVFAKKDREPFRVTNVAQGGENVELGPYYLVWDNISNPALIHEGASGWPYQVTEIGLSSARMQSLLPGEMSPLFFEASRLAKKHCLTCHQINGYGGEKFPINLARIVKDYKEAAFVKWVLHPQGVNPRAGMPPLLPSDSDTERRRVASLIYNYLLALPVTE
tara:strand:- start:8213 stop:9079 length:867 start_codon:yes stop_codon:yes gene_type:complete